MDDFSTYPCKICDRDMEGLSRNANPSRKNEMDWTCKSQDDHHFSYRVLDEKIIKMRIRLTEPGRDGALRLKIHYDLGFSEVWTKAGSSHRIKINSIVVPDFSDLEKLKNKIKTYLVFG